MSKRDLDWSDVVADAERGEGVMFGKNMTATELKYQLTEPTLGHAIPENYVEDFFEFAQAVNCDLSLMAFYRWYRLPSLNADEVTMLMEALKGYQALKHMHLQADIEGELTHLDEHKNTQREAEATTNLINRLGFCSYRSTDHLWCVLDRHPSNVPHQVI